jgi:hypothetical protein
VLVCFVFTVIGLTSGGSSTVHIYTQTAVQYTFTHKQQYSTHLHTNSTQNTEDGTHITINLIKSTFYGMHQQVIYFNNYALPTLHLCVLHLSENKQRLVPFALKNWFVFLTEKKGVYSAVRTGPLNEAVCAPSFKG